MVCCEWCVVSGLLWVVGCRWCVVGGVLWVVYCGWCILGGVLWVVYCGWCVVSGALVVMGGTRSFIGLSSQGPESNSRTRCIKRDAVLDEELRRGCNGLDNSSRSKTFSRPT